MSWPRELKLYPALKQLTLDMASSIFLGLALGPESKIVDEAFVAAVSASIALVRSDLLPMTTYARGMRGRRTLERFFATLIRERRKNPGADLLSELCKAKSEDGERFSDDEITDHMIFLMMAAHDTTTSALSSVSGRRTSSTSSRPTALPCQPSMNPAVIRARRPRR